MKLYYSKGACSLVVRIILNELNCSFQDESVDLKAKKTTSGADFLTINSKGAVPTLGLDNGEVLTENQVILQYLADTNANGSKLLAKVGELTRYRTLEWLNYISTELHKTFSMLFNPSIPEEIKSNVIIPLIMKKFKFINEHLSKNTYMMGEQFTLPDAYLFVMIRWAQSFKIDLSSCSKVEAFFKRLKERPSVKKSLEQEHLTV